MGKPAKETIPTKGLGKSGKDVKGYPAVKGKDMKEKGKAIKGKGKDINGKGKDIKGKGKDIKGKGKDSDGVKGDKGKGANMTIGEPVAAPGGTAVKESGGKDAGKTKGKKGPKGTEVEDQSVEGNHEAKPMTESPAVEGKSQSGKNEGPKGAKGKTGKKEKKGKKGPDVKGTDEAKGGEPSPSTGPAVHEGKGSGKTKGPSKTKGPEIERLAGKDNKGENGKRGSLVNTPEGMDKQQRPGTVTRTSSTESVKTPSKAATHKAPEGVTH